MALGLIEGNLAHHRMRTMPREHIVDAHRVHDASTVAALDEAVACEVGILVIAAHGTCIDPKAWRDLALRGVTEGEQKVNLLLGDIERRHETAACRHINKQVHLWRHDHEEADAMAARTCGQRLIIDRVLHLMNAIEKVLAQKSSILHEPLLPDCP